MKRVYTFKQGDKVKWASQAAGFWVVKVGVVVEVVPPMKHPRAYPTDGTRPHESYVVTAQPIVPGYGKRPRKLGKSQTYWPTASGLRPWSGSMASAATRVSR